MAWDCQRLVWQLRIVRTGGCWRNMALRAPRGACNNYYYYYKWRVRLGSAKQNCTNCHFQLHISQLPTWSSTAHWNMPCVGTLNTVAIITRMCLQCTYDRCMTVNHPDICPAVRSMICWCSFVVSVHLWRPRHHRHTATFLPLVHHFTFGTLFSLSLSVQESNRRLLLLR